MGSRLGYVMLLALVACSPAVAAVDETLLVSRVGLDGPGANAESKLPSISDDGRFIAFTTRATNLGGDPGYYVKDMTTGALTRMGPIGSHGLFLEARLSDNGRFLCFIDSAPSLGSGTRAVVSEVATGIVRSVAGADFTTAPAVDFGRVGHRCDVSDDGNRVAFVSREPLDPVDTEPPGTTAEERHAAADVYVHDFTTNTDILASRQDGAGGEDADGQSVDVSLTPDGRFVLFRSRDTNLTTLDDDGAADVFRRDLVANTTVWASRANGPDGGPGVRNEPPTVSNHLSGSQEAELSDDGRWVAMVSFRRQMDPALPTFPGSANAIIRDLVAGTTRSAARRLDPDGEVITGSNTNFPTISDSGRFLSMGSAYTDLDVLTDQTDSIEDIYVHDQTTSRTTLVSRASGLLGVLGDSLSLNSTISGDARFVVFESDASNFSDADFDGAPLGGFPQGADIFVRQTDAGERPLVDDLPGPPPVGEIALIATTPETTTELEETATPREVRRYLARNTNTAVPRAGRAVAAAAGPPAALTAVLGEYGRLTLVVERRLAGKRKGGRCVTPTRKLRKHRRCARYRRVALRTVAGYEGTNTFTLATVLGTRRLARGTYRLRLVHFDLGKEIGARARTFRVSRRGR